MAKNLCGKTRPVDNPYEVWESSRLGVRWLVLKKYQSPDKEKDNPYARWYCQVTDGQSTDLGDVYVEAIKRDGGVLVEKDGVRVEL